MHVSVLLNETVELLGIKPDGLYVDGTLGGGGHAEAILRRLTGGGRLLGLDRDEEALQRAKVRLNGLGARSLLEHGNFADMETLAQHRGFDHVDGVVLDLGMSSDQVDEAARGFSFAQDGPLDMRMDRTQSLTAAELVNSSDERTLMETIRSLGEEPHARSIARRIVQERSKSPITTTLRLADIVAEASGGRRGRLHPATRTFQALRMAVNRELESLEQGVEAAVRLLAVGGRLAVISFHSLEDRMVKHTMARHVGRWESLQAGGRAWQGALPCLRWVTRKAVTPGPREVELNPRSRSAKLRVVERIVEPC